MKTLGVSPMAMMMTLQALATTEPVLAPRIDPEVSGESPYFLRFLGDPILNTPCVEVECKEDIPIGLLPAMLRVCHAGGPGTQGLGLAANQVGSRARIVVIRKSSEAQGYTVMINPSIVTRLDETDWMPESCLSIPGFNTTMKRNRGVVVAFRDEEWTERVVKASGRAAQVIQHELDHLDGKLITDGLSRQQRRQAERCVERHR